jgi:hypothetical protein
MSLELSGEITAIATSVLALFAIVTAAFAILAFRKQSQEVRDQSEQLKIQSGALKVQSEQLTLQRQATVMQAEAFVRDRVWAILTKEPGLRTVIALDENDGDTGKRVKLLQRTAEELDVAGAAALGEKLRNVLQPGDQGWGAGTTKESRLARKEFVDSAIQFMNAPPS